MSTLFTLQLNNAGAWKSLIDFYADQIDSVQRASERLVWLSATNSVTLRIIADGKPQAVWLWRRTEGWVKK